MIRKISLWGVAVLAMVATVFCSFTTVRAQVVDQLPEVYVKSIALSSDEYKAGDTVKGTFKLWNPNAESVPEVYYRVSLVGGYKANGLAANVYDTKDFGPVFVGGNSEKSVSFSYALPAGIDGSGLGIQIRAVLKSGDSLSWSDAKVTVNKATTKLGAPTAPVKEAEGFPVKITSATLSVHGRTFGVQEGPTIRGADVGKLMVTLSNPGKTNVSATPKVDYFNRTTLGKPISSYKGEALTLKPGATKYSLDLPHFDNVPGVYVGKIVFETASGTIAQPLEYRYIVAGSIVTIQSLTSNVQKVDSGKPVLLTMSYTGAPYDIENGDPSGDSKADLAITLYNETEQAIGTYKESMDFSQGTEKKVSITATAAGSKLKATAVVTKDGQTIATYTAVLTDPNPPTQASATGSFWWLALCLTSLVIAAWIVKRIGNKSTPTIPPAVPMAIFIAIAFFGFSHNAFAWTVTSTENHTCADADYGGSGYCWPATANFVPSVSISTPAGSYSAGASVFLMGSLNARACLNQPQDMKFTITTEWNNQTYTYVQTRAASGGEVITNSYFDFSYGVTENQGFTVPAAGVCPGNVCKITMRVDNYLNIPNRNAANQPYPKEKALRGAVVGYQTFTVNEAAPPTTGTVQLVYMNDDGTPHTSSYPSTLVNPQTQGFLERYYGDVGGTGWYKYKGVNAATGQAIFTDVTAGSGYTSALRVAPATLSSYYSVYALGASPAHNLAQSLKSLGQGILTATGLTPETAVADTCTINEYIAADACTYLIGATECTPHPVFGIIGDSIDTRLYTRTVVGGGQSSCHYNVYYTDASSPEYDGSHPLHAADVIAGKVTKILFLWQGNPPANYKYHMDALDIVLDPDGTPVDSPVSVTNDDDGTPEQVTLTQGTITPASGITMSWPNGNASTTAQGINNTFAKNLRFVASAADAGKDYDVTVTGVSAGGPGSSPSTRTTSIHIHVNNAPDAFTYTVSPQNISVAAGTSQTDTVTVTNTNGIGREVILTLPPNPSGITMSWVTDNKCTPPASGTCSRQFTVTATAGATPGTFSNLVVAGATAAPVVTANGLFNITVTGGQTGDLVVECRPTVVNPLNGQVVDPTPQAGIGQEVTWKSTVDEGSGPTEQGNYIYQWKFLEDNSTTGGSGPTYWQAKRRYYQIGIKRAQITATTLDGTKTGTKICSTGVTVKLNPDWGQF